MSDSKSPTNSIGDLHFSSDEEYKRPRRAAAGNRGAFVEEGTDSDEPGSSNKRKLAKKTKNLKKQPPAKKPKVGSSSDSDSDDDDLKDKDLNRKDLTEKERELEIFRHIEQQELMKTRKQIQQKLLGEGGSDAEDSKGKGKSSDKESGEESSSSSDEEKDKKNESEEEESDVDMDTEFHRPSEVAKKIEKKQAIADLIKTRKEKKLQEEKRKDTLDVDKVFGGGDSASDESSSSDSTESESDESDDERRRSSPELVKGEPVNETLQLNMMRMSRFKLAKIVHAPFFEKTVLGCFVRVGVGVANGEQVYRAGQVIGVVQTAKQYNVEAVRTDKGLKLKHGPDERVYRLEFISNKPISDKEFYKWKDHMIRNNLPLPTVAFAEKKKEDIENAMNYTFTDDDIKKMVNENLKFKSAPTNYAVHKAELMKTKLDAEQRGDYDKANEIQSEIDRIDELIKKKEREMNQEGVAITFINQRNRELQRMTIAQIKPDDTNKEDDPFTRKSGKMRPVSGKAKNNSTTTDDSGINQDKKSTSNTSISEQSILHHSVSAPILKSFDPSLLLTAVPEKKEGTPTLNNSQSSNVNGASKEGRLSLAEYRRRKAAAAGK